MKFKKYLLDYGKSSEAVFEYDENMQLNPGKSLVYFINEYMKLCEKYSYSYNFMKKIVF